MNKQELLEAAQNFQSDLIRFAPRFARAIPEFKTRFLPVLTAYPLPFQVKRLKDDGAFAISSRQLIFNSGSFRLFHKPIDKLERQGVMPCDVAQVARLIAVEQLIFHELTHVTVGLVLIEDVQKLKHLMGVGVLGEMDLVADATAARVCARLEMYRAQERGTAVYASRLMQQLYVMGDFALAAFGAPADKPHKRQRFLGIAMMTARLHDFLQRGGRQLQPTEYPIDTPLYPHVDLNNGSIMISAFSPDRTLWRSTSSVDPTLLKLTYDKIETAPFAETVGRAHMLLKQIGSLHEPMPHSRQSATLNLAAS